MHIIITGVQMEITDAIRSYIHEKMRTVEKLIPRDDTSSKLSVELSKTSNHHVNGEVFKVEVLLHMRGKDLPISTVEDDLYKAIDVVKDKLVHELSQHKDKERSLLRRGAHRVKNLFKRIH